MRHLICFRVCYVVGENEIEYTHNYGEEVLRKKVKLIAIGEIEANFDNIEKIGDEGNNHELFEKLAQDIYNNEYREQEYCYWICGYGTGGAVANVLAAKMIDNGLYYVPKGGIATRSNAYITYDNGQSSTQSKQGQVISNVYAYTFGAPYTIYNGGELKNVDGQRSKYMSIFNVINEDDIVAYMPSSLLGFSRYGVQVMLKDYSDLKTTKAVIEYIKNKDKSESYQYNSNKEIRIEIEKVFYSIFKKDIRDVREVYNSDENLRKAFKDIVKRFVLRESLINEIKDISEDKYKLDIETKAKLLQFATLLNTQYNTNINDRRVVQGMDQGSYYYLSKALKPENITPVVDNRLKGIQLEKETEEYSPVVLALEEMGKWYVDNVYTYWAGTYGAETKNNITGEITYSTNSQTYQDKFKNDFKINYEKSSHNAKKNRKEYMLKEKKVKEEDIELIMEDINVKKAIEDGTFNKLDVDVLKKKEKYEQSGFFGYYNNDIINEKVRDDCSSFVGAVIYKVINDAENIDEKLKYKKMPHYTSKELLKKNVKDELVAKGFICYEGKKNDKNTLMLESVLPLQPGDILVRDNHVEFYVDKDKSFGWGEIHSSYENNAESKAFRWHIGTEDEEGNNSKKEEYYFYNLNKSSEGHYTRVYRYKGNR